MVTRCVWSVKPAFAPSVPTTLPSNFSPEHDPAELPADGRVGRTGGSRRVSGRRGGGRARGGVVGSTASGS